MAQYQTATVKLLKNVDAVKGLNGFSYYGIELSGAGNVTLDLNGCSIKKYSATSGSDNRNAFFYVTKNAKLTITDSVGGGEIIQPVGAPAIIVDGNASLTVKSGTISNTGAGRGIRIDGGTLAVKGGTINASFDAGICVGGGTVTAQALYGAQPIGINPTIMTGTVNVTIAKGLKCVKTHDQNTAYAYNNTDGTSVTITKCTEHKWSYTNMTDDTHDQTCDLCGTTEMVAHSPARYRGTPYTHHVYCACGKGYATERHSFTFTPNDDSYSQPGYDKRKHAVKIEYLVSDTILSEEVVKASSGFREYTIPIGLSTERQYVVYVRLTDHAGNIAYASSDGFEIDKTAPVIENMVDGGHYTYCKETKIKISDKNIKTITLDGREETLNSDGMLILRAYRDEEQTLSVTDEAGNTITVYIAGYTKHDFDEETL